jgi:predicted nucleic acid-binding Zn ribbon protein
MALRNSRQQRREKVIIYMVFLVIAIIAWIIATGSLTVEAFDYPNDAQKAKRARLAWLSFFLIPLYPAVVIVVLIVGPIMVFRRLGRISKEQI